MRRAGFALERRLFEEHHEQVKEDTTSAPASIRVDRDATLSSMRISSTAAYDVDLPGLQTPDTHVVIRETRQEQILDPVALLKRHVPRVL